MQAWEEKIYERREAREEGREEGLAEGRREGIAEGERRKLQHQIQKKLEKNMSIEEIADMLEEDMDVVRELAEELNTHH